MNDFLERLVSTVGGARCASESGDRLVRPSPRAHAPLHGDARLHGDAPLPADAPLQTEAPAQLDAQAHEDARMGTGAAPQFSQLYQEHFDFVWRSLRHLGVGAHALDDAVQEVWLVVHRKLPAFEGRSRPSTWLFGIALNVARSQRRKQRPSNAQEFDDLPSRSPDPEHVLVAQDAWAVVRSFLDTLDEPSRAIFVSALLENLSPRETAEAIGIEVEIVYRRVRALRRAVSRHLRLSEERSP